MKVKTVAKLLGLGLLFVAGATQAMEAGIHLGSEHFRTGPNNTNPGFYVRENGWQVGGYYNSHKAASFYVGWFSEFAHYGRAHLGYGLGGVTGYFSRPVTPFAVATLRLSLTDRDSVLLWIVPSVSRSGPSVNGVLAPLRFTPLVHLTLERRF